MIGKKYTSINYHSNSYRRGNFTKNQWEHADSNEQDFLSMNGKEFVVTSVISEDSLGRKLLLVYFYNDNLTDAMFDGEIEEYCSRMKPNFNKFWNETCLT